MNHGPRIYRTRFPELGFAKFGDDWRLLSMAENNGLTSDGRSYCAIGPFYHSKAELLGDLTRYATDYGLL